MKSLLFKIGDEIGFLQQVPTENSNYDCYESGTLDGLDCYTVTRRGVVEFSGPVPAGSVGLFDLNGVVQPLTNQAGIPIKWLN
jgi:hypothetical protein